MSGSLYLDPTDTQLTFVKTVVVGANGLPVNSGACRWAAYTVTLNSFSAALGRASTRRPASCSTATATARAGDNYTATFHVVGSTPAAGDVLLPASAVLATVPDFARGPNTPSVAIAAGNGATEAGNTVTITTTAGHGFTAGQTVVISGVGVAGYNGTFTIASVPQPTTFTYTDAASQRWPPRAAAPPTCPASTCPTTPATASPST